MAELPKLELPSWTNERNDYIFSGNELVAYRNAVEDVWYVKTSRCSMCGNCCRNFKQPDGTYKDCEHLEDYGDGKFICGFRLGRPMDCSFSLGSSRYEGCTEKFKRVD